MIYYLLFSLLAVGVLGRPGSPVTCHNGERFDEPTQTCISDLVRIDMKSEKPNCPYNQTVAILLPHESDCSKFYYCVNGILTVTDCPFGTEFEPISGNCNWPTEDGCYSKTTTLPPTTDITTTTESSSTTDEPVSTTTPTLPDTTPIPTTVDPEKPVCPENTTSITIIPSPTECDKFYICLGGEATEYTCEDGNEFDPIVQDCVPISPEGCFASHAPTTVGPTTSSPIPTTIDTTLPPTTLPPTTLPPTTLPPTTLPPTTLPPTTLPPTTLPPTTLPPTTLPPTTPAPPKCPENTTSITIIPSPTDCDKFYICLSGEATEYTCESGNEFDPVVQDCVPISPEGCYASQGSKPNITLSKMLSMFQSSRRFAKTQYSARIR